MDSTNENNLFDFVDEDLLEKGIKKIREFSRKDFARFSAIIAVCFSIALWITRSMGYFYMLGRFSVYNIDKSYIDVWSEGFLAQIIQSASTCILLLAVNYKYFQLSIQKDVSKIIRILRKSGFVLLEFVALSSWVLFANEISLFDLLKELPYTPKVKILALVIVWVFALVMVNILGIEAAFFYKASTRKKKEVDEDEREIKIEREDRCKSKKKKRKRLKNKEQSEVKQGDTKYQRWIKVIRTLLITCIVEFVFMYMIGVLTERQRSEFKFVVEETENVVRDKYLFVDEKNGGSYYLYPIIFENQDVYILSRICRNGDCLTIDYDFLKVIDKEGVSTYYVDKLKIEREF